MEILQIIGLVVTIGKGILDIVKYFIDLKKKK